MFRATCAFSHLPPPPLGPVSRTMHSMLYSVFSKIALAPSHYLLLLIDFTIFSPPLVRIYTCICLRRLALNGLMLFVAWVRPQQLEGIVAGR